DPDVLVAVEGQQVVNNREVVVRLAIAVLPCPVVNRSEVVQHPIRLRNLILEITQQVVDVVLGCPVGRNAVARRLWCEHTLADLVLESFVNGRIGDSGHIQTSSGERRVATFSRSARLRSRIDGSWGGSPPFGPTTQLNGLRSLPTAFCSSIRPSRKASGRGGQPGTYTSTGRNLSTPWTTL